jgi:predicted PhzF superfamily epimerase YddE/YHI9
MAELSMWQVDAFADRVFAGNPAAVLVLDGDWLPEAVMQAIAAENNLAETAFARPKAGGGWDLRWFTPVHEADFCGHATLATAHVLAAELGIVGDLVFSTRVGELRVGRRAEAHVLDLPAFPPEPLETPPAMLAEIFPAGWRDAFRNFENLFVVLPDEAALCAFVPDLGRIATLHPRGLCITAPGARHDIVSRYFAPGAGIPEDPVTGSTHATLVPYWASKLGRTTLSAFQCSRRGGELGCELDGARVRLTGRAVTFMTASIRLPA